MTLTEQCLQLPWRERVGVYEALKNSLFREGRETLHRGGILMGYMEQVLGEPIPNDSKRAIYVWARAMVAYQLIQEGYSLTETGRMLGKKHCTIIWLRRKMQDALDCAYAYKSVIEMWTQFQNKINDEIHRGTITDPVSLGG